MLPEYIKSGEVACMLGVHISTVQSWHKSGKLLPSHITPAGTRLYKRQAIVEMIASSDMAVA